MATFLDVFVDCCLFACCPGGCRGNTEQVIAQWCHTEASSIALNMLHWAIRAALHPRIHMAIKMAHDGGTFLCCCCLFCLTNHSQITCLYLIWTNCELHYCSLICNWLVHIVWASIGNNGCHFGHHCHRHASPNCHIPPSYVPYTGTCYVPYDGTFGTPDQGQMLDVWESQTTVSALRWLAPYRSMSYSWSCSWSYSWSYSWTHVLGTKTMTSLILDHVAMGYLYLGTSMEKKICSWDCLRTRLW